MRKQVEMVFRRACDVIPDFFIALFLFGSNLEGSTSRPSRLVSRVSPGISSVLWTQLLFRFFFFRRARQSGTAAPTGDVAVEGGRCCWRFPKGITPACDRY